MEWAEDRCCKLIGRLDSDDDDDYDEYDDDDDYNEDDDNDGIVLAMIMNNHPDDNSFGDEKGRVMMPQYSDCNPFIAIGLAEAPAYLMKWHKSNQLFCSKKYFQKERRRRGGSSSFGWLF